MNYLLVDHPSLTNYVPPTSVFGSQVKKGGVLFDTPHVLPLSPITNRGVKSENADDNHYDLGLSEIQPNQDPLEDLYVRAIGSGNKAKVIRVPKPDTTVSPDYAFFDWVNFTFKKIDYSPTFENDDDLVMSLSSRLFDIFGYGVSSKRANGLNMYAESWNLGKEGWGFVCVGGQADSLMVSIKAQGLYSAKDGWEHRLYKFLKSIDSAKLTRVDLAHDSFVSKRTINDYFDMYQRNLFTSRGRPPQVHLLGDWINENDKGRTLNIGSRKAGKVLRIYEKGLQLGRGFSNEYPRWIRIELEIRSAQRELPPEMLLNPAHYLAGAYPALAFICHKQEVILTRKKSAKILVDFSLEVTRHQFGKHIKAHAELFGAEAAIQILTMGVEDLPERLDLDDYETFNTQAYLETENIEILPLVELLHNFVPKHFQHLDYGLFKSNPIIN